MPAKRNANAIFSLIILFFIAGLFFAPACSEEELPSDAQAVEAATFDAAINIGYALGLGNGGSLAQIDDMLGICSPYGISGVHYTPYSMKLDSSYDVSTGTWTVTIQYAGNGPDGIYHGWFSRTYRIQFLKADGTPQQYYAVPTLGGTFDTACSMHFNLIAGAGFNSKPRVGHRLREISADVYMTGLTGYDSDSVLITGTWDRKEIDTCQGGNYKRIHNCTITAKFDSVRIPCWKVRRGNASHEYITASIKGIYHANVTFLKGEKYSERVVDRAFTVNFNQNMQHLVMRIGNKVYHFSCMGTYEWTARQ